MENGGIEYGQIQGIEEKASRAAYLTTKNTVEGNVLGILSIPGREGGGRSDESEERPRAFSSLL